jgi:hypothetical protein
VSETPEPFTYAFHWTPEVYAQLAARRPPATLQVTGSRRRLALAVLATLVALLAIALLPVLLGLLPRGALLALLWGAVAALLAVLLVIIPYVKRTRVAADMATRARQGEVRATLGPAGIETRTDLAFTRSGWGAVSEVSAAPKATLLWIGALTALPVPDAALPAGVDRAEALRRIAIWRGADA